MSNPNLSAYVADHLRACQLKQLSILEEVDRICKKHGIGYWLDGGSLLGAVRHGGFILFISKMPIFSSPIMKKVFLSIFSLLYRARRCLSRG